MKKVIFILFAFCSVFQGLLSQKHQFGIKGGLYSFYYFGEGVVGNWFLDAHSPIISGKTIGPYYRFESRFLYIESELTYCYNQTTIGLTNLDIERDYGGHHISNTITAGCQNEIGVALTVGGHFSYKKVNFRGYIGVKPSLLFKEDTTHVFTEPWDEIKRSIYNSYEPKILYGNWGFGIDYWRLSLDIKRENNLTPIISSVNYEGGTYDYNLDTKRLFIILGFNFYPWKVRNKSAVSPLDL